MMLSLGRGLAPVRKMNIDSSLKSVIPSCVFDLDATKLTSYLGTGQMWKNLVPAPSDGSAQSAYDFMLGATTGSSADDPTFTGSPGNAAAYFSFDGGDVLRLSANTTFLNNLPKTTGGSLPVTYAIAFRAADEGTTKNYIGHFGAGVPSVRIRTSSTELIGLQQGDGSGTFSSAITGSLTIGTDYLFIGSLNSDGSWRQWLNSRIKTSGSITLMTNTANGGAFRIMDTVANGVRLYAASLYNAFIDDAEAVKIINTYNARHGRTYA